MVADCETNDRLVSKVAEIYKHLDSQIGESSHLVGMCSTCGRCCDFEIFGHKLFVTVSELMYLVVVLGAENIKPMTSGRCPYNIEGKCSIYEHRFASCRIFACKGDKDFQSQLSESALKEFKSLCTEFKVPYNYTDLAAALNSIAAG